MILTTDGHGSPSERGRTIARLRDTGAFLQFERWTPSLPLPEGEGRGEGESICGLSRRSTRTGSVNSRVPEPGVQRLRTSENIVSTLLARFRFASLKSGWRPASNQLLTELHPGGHPAPRPGVDAGDAVAAAEVAVLLSLLPEPVKVDLSLGKGVHVRFSDPQGEDGALAR
jgi:hypothetical protein